MDENRRGRLQQAAREGRITLADTTLVDTLEPWVERVLEAASEAVGEPGVFLGSMVTDESTVSDFLCFDDKAYPVES